jgi:DNA-binding transcriptional ArsR family regulator
MAQVHESLKRRKLRMLSLLRGEFTAHGLGLPLSTSDDVRPDIDTELHQITSAPAAFTGRLVGRLRENGTADLRRLSELNEAEFARLFAMELEQLWQDCLAPRWSAMASQAEADVEHRARAAARAGLGTVLDNLHPAIAYHDETIRLSGSREADVEGVERITLYPTALTWMYLADIEPGGAGVSYPARALGGADQHDDQALADVLGHTRLALLTSLRKPHTTSELAELHHLSRSTVSYHLARLNRAGLVTRVRSGNSVYYECGADIGRLGLPRRTPEPAP